MQHAGGEELKNFQVDRLAHRLPSPDPSRLFFKIQLRHSLSTSFSHKMEVSDLLPLVEQLDDNVDDLEEAIAPLLNQPLTEISKKLPVLDKAKLHVVTTYALESLIFCKLIDICITILY